MLSKEELIAEIKKFKGNAEAKMIALEFVVKGTHSCEDCLYHNKYVSLKYCPYCSHGFSDLWEKK